MNPAIRTIVLALSASLLLVSSATAMQVTRSAIQIPQLTADQLEFLSHVSMVDLPDGQGGFVRTARISGINVQVVNGSGATNGTPDGLGNLIVGYNELRGAGDDRTGSHNLVTGRRNNYKSYGGLIGGASNEISGNWSSVSGGVLNTASGAYSSVSGGRFNTASGIASTVSGGASRSATGTNDWVAGSLFETN